MAVLLQVEEQVKDYAVQWERENGRRFFVYGVTVHEYIDSSWREFSENKIREKEERVSGQIQSEYQIWRERKIKLLGGICYK